MGKIVVIRSGETNYDEAERLAQERMAKAEAMIKAVGGRISVDAERVSGALTTEEHLLAYKQHATSGLARTPGSGVLLDGKELPDAVEK